MRKLYFPLLSAILAATLLLPCVAFAQTATPSPTPMESESDLVPHSYFDDTLFVGDSISLQLRNYVTKRRANGEDLLGKAQFFTAGGFGSGIALTPVTSSSFHPYLNDEKMYVEDAVALSGAKKVYLMLGMNDIVPYGPEGAVQQMTALVERILARTPDVTLAFQSVTPILTDKQQRNLNNPNIQIYNAALQDFCNSNGYEFLDVAAVLRDTDGGLIYAYCGDAPGLGMHISNEGCPPWIQFLRANPITEVEEAEEVVVEAIEEDGEALREAATLPADGDDVFRDYEDPEAASAPDAPLSDYDSTLEEILPPDKGIERMYRDYGEAPITPKITAPGSGKAVTERSRMNIAGTSTVTATAPSATRKKGGLLAPRS